MRRNKSHLGVHLTHDSSVCQVTNGQIDWFAEEERFSRVKHDSYPSLALLNMDLRSVDSKVQISGLYEPHDKDKFVNDVDSFSLQVAKKYTSEIAAGLVYKNVIEYESYLGHHLFHAACGFYNSGFPRAAVLVVDGMGNPLEDKDNIQEVESIYTCGYPTIFKRHSTNVTPTFLEADKMPLSFGFGMIYQAMSNYFGFGDFGSGKLMGLSSYGKEDPNIKSFLHDDGTPVTDLFYRSRFGLTFIPYDYVRYPKDIDEFIDIDSKDMKQRFANLAYRVQKDFETYMTALILKTLDITGEKNLVLTGGCALNCVANYEYLKHLPEDVKLYVEPISTDAGVSIGLAKIDYYSATKSTSRHPLKTLYLGKE